MLQIEPRVCHHGRCAKTYHPRRRDQKHCSNLCSQYCRECKLPAEKARLDKDRAMRQGGKPFSINQHGQRVVTVAPPPERSYREGKPWK